MPCTLPHPTVPAQIAKAKLDDLCVALGRRLPDLCRVVARVEAERRASDIQPLVESLSGALHDWRETRD